MKNTSQPPEVEVNLATSSFEELLHRHLELEERVADMGKTIGELRGVKFLFFGASPQRIRRVLLRAKELARAEGGVAMSQRLVAKIWTRMRGREMPGFAAMLEDSTTSPGPRDALASDFSSTVAEPLSELVGRIRSTLTNARQAFIVSEQYSRNLQAMADAPAGKGPNHVGPSIQPRPETPIKLIAFYLPQFHPIAENDQWWGRGFTEWTNVSRGLPFFSGHYQPHLPGELGFYDLRIPEVLEKQVEMAMQYGLHGFAFYYYWFAGKRLLEKPMDVFVSNPKIDFPFCIVWANENWTRRWDGLEEDILMRQEHTPATDLAFIRDLLSYLKHPNYIKVNGRPLIAIYRPDMLPEFRQTAASWRKFCEDNGVGPPYLVAALTFDFSEADAERYGFDAAMEFPPHRKPSGFCLTTPGIKPIKPDYAGGIYSYANWVASTLAERRESNVPIFETAFPMWDNAARRQDASTLAYSNPLLYKLWLDEICDRTLASDQNPERIAFVNAWNEWAEGAHLEPDKRYGFAYLEATRQSLAKAAHRECAPAIDPAQELKLLQSTDVRAPILVFSFPGADSAGVLDGLNHSPLSDRVIAARQLMPSPTEPVQRKHLTPVTDRKESERRTFLLRESLFQTPDKELKVVTTIREPVASEVDAFFDEVNLLISNFEHRIRTNDITPAELYQVFLHFADHDAPDRWFDEQYKPAFGIDVFASPFNWEQGFAHYENDKSCLLIVRSEDIEAGRNSALKNFLLLSEWPDTPTVGETEVYEIYLSLFKQDAWALTAYFDKVYSSRYAKHFYSPIVLDQMRGSWLARS